jgi:hypothetical protein
MTMHRVIGVTATAACAAVAIAGCGTTHAPSGGAAAASASASGSASPPASTASATPRSRAAADAASILASFVPPPGAARLPAEPAADGGALSRPAAVPRSTDLVDDVSWWHVPGSPQAVLVWEKAHLPGRYTLAGSGTAGSPPTVWSQQYTLPSVAGVLIQRELDMETVSAGGGQSAVRVDAQVAWLPAKPASERIPAGAKQVTISAISGPIVGAKVPAPVTITNAATVQRIASLVDGLPIFPPGVYSCPADLGRAVQMTFRATAGGPPLAVVTAGLASCQGVGFTVGGQRQPALADGASLARQVLAITGLRWTGYGGGALMPGTAITPGGVMQHG